MTLAFLPLRNSVMFFIWHHQTQLVHLTYPEWNRQVLNSNVVLHKMTCSMLPTYEIWAQTSLRLGWKLSIPVLLVDVAFCIHMCVWLAFVIKRPSACSILSSILISHIVAADHSLLNLACYLTCHSVTSCIAHLHVEYTYISCVSCFLSLHNIVGTRVVLMKRYEIYYISHCFTNCAEYSFVSTWGSQHTISPKYYFQHLSSLLIAL